MISLSTKYLFSDLDSIIVRDKQVNFEHVLLVDITYGSSYSD